MRFHPRRFGGPFVIVALQVQHAVDDKVRAMRGERFALLHGLAPQHRSAEHDITARRAMFIIVHERQHVGGTVLAAMPTIERAAFGFLNEPEDDRHVRSVGDQRRFYPAPKQATCRQIVAGGRELYCQ